MPTSLMPTSPMPTSPMPTSLMPIPDILKTEFNLSHHTGDMLHAYLNQLIFWNRTHRIIGTHDNKILWHRHIADSLTLLPHIAPSINHNAGCLIADLGSGAGFPAIPLAIATADTDHPPRFDLVEKNRKKAACLRHIAATLKLNHITIHHTSIETYLNLHTPHIITARALAPLQTLLTLTYPHIIPPVKAFFFKGQNVDRELTEAQKYWTIQYRIKQSHINSGVILIIEKLSPK